MKLVIAATPRVAIPTIEELVREHQVTLVTQPDRPAGRGNHLRASEVALAFPDALKPTSEEELGNILEGSDLLLTIGYGRILKDTTLQIPRFGGINLHFSLLPKWRGAAPVQRAIENGDKTSGVTVFQMDSGMDTGPIWQQIEYQIPETADSNQLFDELAILGTESVKRALRNIENGSKPTPQQGVASIAKKIDKTECIIDWKRSADEIWRKIRAFGANPGVSSTIRGSRIKLVQVNPVTSTTLRLPAGALTEDGLVGTGDGVLQLIKVLPAGKKEMVAKEWLNGFKPKPGEIFE